MTHTDRPNDITLLGATGFTGRLIAHYLDQHAPAATRIVLAGRNPAKLESVTEGMTRKVEVARVDVTDPSSVRGVAESTRVLITTVGPYIEHGEPVVAACAVAGTDYLDLTGEPEFLDLMYLKYHATAASTGARLIHSAGFDSMPHDLGAQFTVEQLPEDVPLTVTGTVRVKGTFSGGTAASALTVLSRQGPAKLVHAERMRVEPPPVNRRARVVTARPGKNREGDGWVLPMPTIDPEIVVQSARGLPRYGPDFSYCHQMAVPNPAVGAGMALGAAALFGIAHIRPAREAVLKLRPSGSGPTDAQRAAAWFSVRFVGEGGGKKVLTEVAGGDPGYTETSKMISEAALCLTHDDLPSTAGQVTTAMAMGAALRGRLERAGMTFRIL
ncbi:MAG TPA: saccharopine dehydrogenase NADP-binding domain-containing protein [Acidimicrobiales bacterium]|nr:saccharopine dehydrogenase NADP-binding domain-containing protein [Acidimicrobiales bacterium]